MDLVRLGLGVDPAEVLKPLPGPLQPPSTPRLKAGLNTDSPGNFPELDINGTNFTPNARFHLEIRNVPVKKGNVVLRDHAFDGKGDFQIFESFEIVSVSVDAVLPDIIVSILDEGSGVTASVHVSPRPFVVRV